MYNSLNKPGLTHAGNSTDIVPPDSTGAIGPNNYVEMANSQVAVWDRSLNLVSSATLQTFLGQSAGVALCDVQIQWDGAANRWLFAVLYCGGGSPQGFFVGWSRNADPSNLSPAGWCEILVTTPNGLGGYNIFDYPKLGHNANYLIVGGNFFTTTMTFITAAIAWTSLPPNGSSTCPASPTFSATSQNPLKEEDGVTNAFTPVPVNITSNSADGYILSAYDPSGGNGQALVTPQNQVGQWRLDSAGVIHLEPSIAIKSYAAPFAAPQSGTADVIDTLDGRLTQAVGDPVTGIWSQHTVDGPGNRSEVDWFEIASGSEVQMGSIASTTDFVFNAAISPETDLKGAAVFYNRASSTTFPVIAAQIRRYYTPLNAMEPGELVLAASAAANTDFSCTTPYGPPCRWGDYSGASPDPNQPNVVWGTNEFINAASVLGAPTWSDENFAIQVAAPPPAALAIVAGPGDNSARVVWTDSTIDDGAPTTSYRITGYVGASIVATLTVPATGTSVFFNDLTDGTTYTFTVIAVNIAGVGAESVHSNPVTPTRAVAPAPAPTIPSRTTTSQLPTPQPPPPSR